MLRHALLAAARSARIQTVAETAPFARDVVRRFTAGESVEDALRACERLTADGLFVTLDHLGEDTVDPARAGTATGSYLAVLDRLAEEGLTTGVEVSVKLTALGLLLDDGEHVAGANAARICAAARAAGTTVTLDMEDHPTVESALGILHELRDDYPETGAVVQSYLRDAERYCRRLAHQGSRVRLCKGAYAAPDTAAFAARHAIDRSYVRCMKVLMRGDGYPMLATHDPRLIEIGRALALRYGRPADTFEYQMLYGVRPTEQRRLTGQGNRVRVYVPYGSAWYGYMMRRIAERPANMAFTARSLLSRR